MSMDEATIGVTGAGGFIGRHVVDGFTDRGHRVLGMCHQSGDAERVESAGGVPCPADVREPSTLGAFCEAADAIVHAAAVVGEDGTFARFRDVNVRGTRTVARIAAESGVRRLVHLSSVMVYGFEFPRNVDETGPLRGEDNPYCTTKIESERVVRAHHGRGDLEVVIARPGDVFGPGSQPWVVRPLELMRRRLFVLPDGGRGRLEPTYVGNLVDALHALLTGAPAGEAYNVTDGGSIQAIEYFERLAGMLGRSSVPTAPGNWLEFATRSVEGLFDAVGVETPIRAASLHFLTRPHGYADDKLRRAIDYEPTLSFEEGMQRTERWARAKGLV